MKAISEEQNRSSDWPANQNALLIQISFLLHRKFTEADRKQVYFFLHAGSPGSPDEPCPDCDPGGPHWTPDGDIA